MIYSWKAFWNQYIIKSINCHPFQHIINSWGREFFEKDRDLAHAFFIFDCFYSSLRGSTGSFGCDVPADQNIKDRNER
jgi:hypothetical protein